MMLIRKIFAATSLIALGACGGGEPSEGGAAGSGGGVTPTPQPAGLTAPTGPMTVPDWYVVDNAARTVRLTVTAGATPANNYWNFNGAINGDLAITVPEGYRVTIEFTNRDPNMAHSLGISPMTTSFALPPEPTPVFAGAITQNPGSMIDGTMPGETETVEFVAERAGNYLMLCYIPGHTAVGMWLFFNVSAGGEAGVQAR
jgi:FtsP/CotA-like multicopper oxidase with cupredoxin domain